MPELVLNLGAEDPGKPFVSKATDPVISLNGSALLPVDFAAQFPQPLDTTELVAMCDEVNLWRALPEKNTSLKQELWRELNELAFTSGSSYISFADGACPEEFYHDGDNRYVDLKNIGAKKSLGISDIMHSAAVSAMSLGGYGVGISSLNGPFAAGEGRPGGGDVASLIGSSVRDVKEKEMTLASILTLNGWDGKLVNGNLTTNALEFDGIETIVTAANGARSDLTNMSGTFSADTFDQALAAGCAKPQVIFGHPQAIQGMLSAYFSLGFQGAQVISKTDDGMVPGFNFAGEVITGVGRLKTVADVNFAKTAVGTTNFQSNLYPLRMQHNGEQLVYKITQIPLAFRDLAPGCTAISFQIWAKTALVIKALCAQFVYRGYFTGKAIAGCPRVGFESR